MTLLNTLLETWATLTKQVANLEQDKIAQAIEITKLKQRVRRLEKKRQYKSSGLKRLRKVDTSHRVESLADTVMDDQEDASKHGGKLSNEMQMKMSLWRKLMLKLHWMLMFSEEVVNNVATTITVFQVPKASAPRRRRGVIIQDPKVAATASVIMQSEVKSKDKGKRILVEEPKPLKRQEQIEHDEAFVRQLEAELNAYIY
nr:hypothetical protein [Tanacetum cinerariifolium]